jgi:hypothetical protein
MEQNEKPKWDELPIGYFYCDGKRLSGIRNEKIMILIGTFIFAGKKESFRPNSGEHLLAVFAYRGERYIYNSTLAYERSDLGRKQGWSARLGLSHQIQKW